jgi:polyhydroxyalkanoate synthase
LSPHGRARFRQRGEGAPRSFQIATKRATDKYADPDTWQAATPKEEGSWWPVWAAWLVRESSGKGPPPAMGAPDHGYPPICAAPGTYVLQE